MTKVLYNPPRLKKKKKSPLFKNWAFLIKILLFFLFLGSIFYFLFFSHFFRIEEIKISGLETISEDILREKLNPILSEKKLIFLSQDNIFLFSQKEVEKTLLKEIPKIRKVSFNKNFLLGSQNKIEIRIEERGPIADWCILSNEAETCFLLDKDGVIFEKKNLSLDLIPKIIDKVSREDVKLGDKVFEGKFLLSLFSAKELFEQNLNIEFREFTIFDEDLVEAKSSLGWKIIFEVNFETTQDLTSQILAMKKILEEMKPEEREKLEYFDLRVKDRIYYK